MMALSDLWNRYKRLTAAIKIIVINAVVFLALRLLGIMAMIGGWNIDDVVNELALPSSLDLLATRPWTVITYMFTHYDPFHLLFNMLTLYWFGKMMTWRCSERQMTWLYIYGGISGALFYLVAALLFAGVGGWLLGASAAVMAIVIATAILLPDYRINFLFIGSVKIKWVAVGAVILFALGLVGDNAGGHVAHFGGMAMGAYFAIMHKVGIDITSPFATLWNYIISFFTKMKSAGQRRKRKMKFRPAQQSASDTAAANPADDRRNLDAILDKIKHSGYTALTPDERRQLFEISRRVK